MFKSITGTNLEEEIIVCWTQGAKETFDRIERGSLRKESP